MIITRTPLRVSLGGGGTDLPSCYEGHAGFVLAAAVSKYVYIGINDTFTDDYFIKYSGASREQDPSRLSNIRSFVVPYRSTILRPRWRSSASPTFRRERAWDHRGPSLWACSERSMPTDVSMWRRVPSPTRHAGSRSRCSACGRKQDQYIAAFGGITASEFNKNGSVVVSPLLVTNDTLHDLVGAQVQSYVGDGARWVLRAIFGRGGRPSGNGRRGQGLASQRWSGRRRVLGGVRRLVPSMPRKLCVAACRRVAEPALTTVFCNEGRYDQSNACSRRAWSTSTRRGSNGRACVTSTME